MATYALVATRTFTAWGAPLGATAAWGAAALLVTVPALWFFWHRTAGTPPARA